MRYSPHLHFPAVPNDTLREIGFWMGYLNDFGKYTDFFQDYLLGKISSPQKQHNHISSFLSAWKIAGYFARRHHLPLSLYGLFPDYEEKPFWELSKSS
ncbi:MAG: hypothetical protein QXM86_00100 [Candidatus Bathyarchaeia archaeon]